MSTIPDTINKISNNIQLSFSELVKLLLRKSLPPVLNPTKSDYVHNICKGRYEKGLAKSRSDNINRYFYTMTRESLGWTDDILANFKITAKFPKGNLIHRFPVGDSQTHNKLKQISKIAFTKMDNKTQYKKILNLLASRNINSIIANKSGNFIFLSDIPYTHAFKQLEQIGKDIIDQTDPQVTGEESSKMSTANLRMKLYMLEQNLGQLSIDLPEIFDAYIEMIRIINSIPKNKIVWVINLIAALSYQRWTELPEKQATLFTDSLGENFIFAFNSNELITILLQSDACELILTSSYLYPLMKMLFIVFGYSKLTPNIITSECDNKQKYNFDKYKNKIAGASLIRNRSQFDINFPQDNSEDSSYSEDIDMIAQMDMDPTDPAIYEYIRMFDDLYPTILGLMGGIEEFPPETIEIACDDIPANYIGLMSIPEYLWRFNDYSYCQYIEYISARHLVNCINSKISEKARYLNQV